MPSLYYKRTPDCIFAVRWTGRNKNDIEAILNLSEWRVESVNPISKQLYVGRYPKYQHPKPYSKEAERLAKLHSNAYQCLVTVSKGQWLVGKPYLEWGGTANCPFTIMGHDEFRGTYRRLRVLATAL